MLIRRKRHGKWEYFVTGDFGPMWAAPISEERYHELRDKEREDDRRREEDDRRRNDELRKILGSDCPE